jgi:hypothetical protein
MRLTYCGNYVDISVKLRGKPRGMWILEDHIETEIDENWGVGKSEDGKEIYILHHKP